MHPDNPKSYQSFRLLAYQGKKATDADQSADLQFVLQEVSGEKRQKTFGTFEQVVNFLLDELKVPKKEDVHH